MDAPCFTLTKPLGKICATEPVGLAYVFGSVARGTVDDESDIDIAVLADDALSTEERLQLRLRLLRSFATTLGTPIDRFDVVVLQDVPTLLQYNVVRGGFAVYERTPTVRAEYQLAVERRYDNVSPLLDRESDLTIDRILSRTA